MTRTEPIFSLVMPYHAAPQMLAKHTGTLCDLPARLSDHVELVVCDDASPVPISIPGNVGNPRATLLRINPPHVRWSHRCATNIAASHACGQWLLITDIDHVVPADTWDMLLHRYAGNDLDVNRVYNFRRENLDGSPKNAHPDTWLIHRTMWHKLGGYDQRYRGYYGQNAAFIERVRHHAGPPTTLYEHLVRYSREDVADASMPVEFGRKCDRDRSAVAAMRAKFRAEGTYWQSQPVIPHVRVYP